MLLTHAGARTVVKLRSVNIKSIGLTECPLRIRRLPPTEYSGKMTGSTWSPLADALKRLSRRVFRMFKLYPPGENRTYTINIIHTLPKANSRILKVNFNKGNWRRRGAHILQSWNVGRGTTWMRNILIGRLQYRTFTSIHRSNVGVQQRISDITQSSDSL